MGGRRCRSKGDCRGMLKRADEIGALISSPDCNDLRAGQQGDERGLPFIPCVTLTGAKGQGSVTVAVTTATATATATAAIAAVAATSAAAATITTVAAATATALFAGPCFVDRH